MKRTDADGHDSNQFTDGDPGLGIVATLVEFTWLNTLQEEIAFIIEAAGITLDQTGTDTTQLAEALGIIGFTKLSFAIPNASAATNITAMVFDKAVVRGFEVKYQIDRRSDSSNVVEIGSIRGTVDPEADTWMPIYVNNDFQDPGLGESGVTFSIVPGTGQMQLSSDDLTGASYAGTLRVIDVKQFKI